MGDVDDGPDLMELLRRFQDGGPPDEFFEVLIRKFGGRLLTICRSKCRDDATARDVVQETLKKALEKLPKAKINDENHLQCWLLRIAGQLFLNEVRRGVRQKTDPILDSDLTDDKPRPFVFEKEPDSNDLRHCIDRLDEPACSVFRMLFRGYGPETIAKELGRNRDFVDKTKLRNKESLRRCLENRVHS